MGLYNVLAFGGLILAILFLILTVVLFFILNIPKVVGAVTGTTEKKAIERIKLGGYESKSKKDAIHKDQTEIRVRNTSTDVETYTDEQKQSALNQNVPPQNVPPQQEAPKAPSYTGFASRGSKSGRSGGNASEEATEILGANEMKYAVGDMEATEVLSGSSEANTSETATDVLPGHDWQSEEDFDADAATDVLTSDGKAPAHKKAPERKPSYDYDDGETAVLTASEMASGVSGAYEDEEATDVLSSGNKTTDFDVEGVTDVLRDETSTETNEEILGRYSPEETAVLRSVDAMGGGPAPAEKRKEEPVIKVLFEATIVHTEETLS